MIFSEQHQEGSDTSCAAVMVVGPGTLGSSRVWIGCYIILQIRSITSNFRVEIRSKFQMPGFRRIGEQIIGLRTGASHTIV